jgi:hypothetical protein
VREVVGEAVRSDEALELGLDLGVGEADRRTRSAVGRVGVRVDERPGEVRVVLREMARRIVVLDGDRVDVLFAAAVVGEVFEVPIQTRLVIGDRRRATPSSRLTALSKACLD